ncbi:MAG: hypothetical protein ABDH32_03745 [Candidatus Caldarchaeales archaeon]
MDVKVVFLAHRVEFLKLLEEEIKGYHTLVLEEPDDENLKNFLNGYISLEEYVKLSNTGFPLYAVHQALLMKKLHSKGVEIIQIEPYLTIMEKIYQSIETGKFEEYILDPNVKRVLEIEKEVVRALIEYQEEFMKGEFNGLVNKVIEFSKKDARRFKLRDLMRAEAVAASRLDDRVVVEAGYMHILLPVYLEEKGVRVSTINLVEKACKILNSRYLENPGDILTKAYITERELGDEERLKAAQSIIYQLLISRDEKEPTSEVLFPHLIEELKIIDEVDEMSYEECRREFYRLLKKTWI